MFVRLFNHKLLKNVKCIKIKVFEKQFFEWLYIRNKNLDNKSELYIKYSKAVAWIELSIRYYLDVWLSEIELTKIFHSF